jgi:hypothetical protein
MTVFWGMLPNANVSHAKQALQQQAQTWTQTGVSFQIRFGLSSAFNTHGKAVHTIYLQTTNQDSLTTYSIWNS